MRCVAEGRATSDDADTRDLYWFLELNETLDVFGDRNDMTLRPPRVVNSSRGSTQSGFANIPIEALAHVPGVDLKK